ncbi:MAG: hypothetical protein Kow00120_14880 [Anaerolineae bacterium]
MSQERRVKNVKVVRFQLTKTDFIEQAEKELSRLLSQGWKIIANGGAGNYAYVILQIEV